MKQTEETASETEAERGGYLRLKMKCGIRKFKTFERVFKVVIL